MRKIYSLKTELFGVGERFRMARGVGDQKQGLFWIFEILGLGIPNLTYPLPFLQLNNSFGYFFSRKVVVIQGGVVKYSESSVEYSGNLRNQRT